MMMAIILTEFFILEKDEDIYIYKTFESHNEYERYLKEFKFDDNLREQIIINSKLYKKEVHNV